MARYITPKNTITTAVFGAALAPAAALACGNSMVTYTPMTYVANVVVLGLPALFFGGIAYLLYRKQKLRALPAILSKRINHGEARFKSDNGKPKDDE